MRIHTTVMKCMVSAPIRYLLFSAHALWAQKGMEHTALVS